MDPTDLNFMSMNCIINLTAGSVPQDAEARLRSALAALGENADIFACSGKDIKSVAHDVLDCDRLIVWGGDGTIAGILDRAGRDGPPVLPLPGGTMNLLHKAVHGGPLD